MLMNYLNEVPGCAGSLALDGLNGRMIENRSMTSTCVGLHRRPLRKD